MDQRYLVRSSFKTTVRHNLTIHVSYNRYVCHVINAERHLKISKMDKIKTSQIASNNEPLGIIITGRHTQTTIVNVWFMSDFDVNGEYMTTPVRQYIEPTSSEEASIRTCLSLGKTSGITYTNDRSVTVHWVKV